MNDAGLGDPPSRLRRYGGQPSSGLPAEARASEAARAKAGAEGGTRTPTTLRPQAPEACASANSATSAGIPAVAPGARRRGVEHQSIPDEPSVPRAPGPATGRASRVGNIGPP